MIMEFNEVLALRKSVRRYTKEIVSQEDEKAMLDAAMASSVGKHNDGGYNLVVVRDREILDLIAKEEKEETGGGDPLFGAPLLFLICRTKEAVEYLMRYDAESLRSISILKRRNWGWDLLFSLALSVI